MARAHRLFARSSRTFAEGALITRLVGGAKWIRTFGTAMKNCFGQPTRVRTKLLILGFPPRAIAKLAIGSRERKKPGDRWVGRRAFRELAERALRTAFDDQNITTSAFLSSSMRRETN
jgi:hypothetical protein